MAGMRMSLSGMAMNTARALESSRDDHACLNAFSVCELVDNLRKVKEGEATIEDFFAVYVFDKSTTKLADSVKRERYYCMRDEPAEDDKKEEAA